MCYDTHLYVDVGVDPLFTDDLSRRVLHPGPGPVQQRDGDVLGQAVYSVEHGILGPPEPSHHGVEGRFSTVDKRQADVTAGAQRATGVLPVTVS